MNLMSLVFAVAFFGWGALDLFTGKSLYLSRFGMAEYDDYDDGIIYWLVVAGKFVAGAHFLFEIF